MFGAILGKVIGTVGTTAVSAASQAVSAKVANKISGSGGGQPQGVMQSMGLIDELQLEKQIKAEELAVQKQGYIYGAEQIKAQRDLELSRIKAEQEVEMARIQASREQSQMLARADQMARAEQASVQIAQDKESSMITSLMTTMAISKMSQPAPQQINPAVMMMAMSGGSGQASKTLHTQPVVKQEDSYVTYAAIGIAALGLILVLNRN